MTSDEIIAVLPYSDPFLFVDELQEISETKITGTYTFKTDAHFYEGHFKDHPVTPGVILTECMAQIGVVCMGICIHRTKSSDTSQMVGLVSTEIQFFKPVLPGETVTVVSERVYFRFGKLKCNVKCIDEVGVVVASGSISGMTLKKEQ